MAAHVFGPHARNQHPQQAGAALGLIQFVHGYPGRLLLLGVHQVHLRVVHGLEVHKEVRVAAAHQREGSAVHDCVALVEHHISRLHGNVVGLACVAVHLDGPGLVHVLRHLDDAGGHQRKPVHVRGEHCPRVVHAHSVHGGGLELVAGPLLQDGFHGLPDERLEVLPPSQLTVLQANHGRLRVPVIHIRVTAGPILGLDVVFISLEPFQQRLPGSLRALQLLESDVGVVVLMRGLVSVHLQPRALSCIALPFAVYIVAALHHLFITELPNGSFLRVEVVVNGKADVHPVVSGFCSCSSIISTCQNVVILEMKQQADRQYGTRSEIHCLDWPRSTTHSTTLFEPRLERGVSWRWAPNRDLAPLSL
mmetsp:Transcript_30411/g.67257  ORF Transcript_30411/g.67257 Transcript_30411/m.67257 type:complete len:364 (+) Transcript_30411:937-2028(+)